MMVGDGDEEEMMVGDVDEEDALDDEDEPSQQAAGSLLLCVDTIEIITLVYRL